MNTLNLSGPPHRVMEEKYSHLTVTILRIAAGVALFGFMLLPQVSCGGMHVSGLDIVRMGTQSPIMSGLSLVVICSAVFALIVPSVLLGVFGLSALMALLILAKLDQNYGAMISIEPGAFVATLGFLMLALKPKIKSILVSSTAPPRREIESAHPATADHEVLTNEDILKMVNSGLGEDILIAKLKYSQCNFLVSSSALLDLKKNNVPENVISVMLENQAKRGRTERSATATY